MLNQNTFKIGDFVTISDSTKKDDEPLKDFDGIVVGFYCKDNRFYYVIDITDSPIMALVDQHLFQGSNRFTMNKLEVIKDFDSYLKSLDDEQAVNSRCVRAFLTKNKPNSEENTEYV